MTGTTTTGAPAVGVFVQLPLSTASLDRDPRLDLEAEEDTASPSPLSSYAVGTLDLRGEKQRLLRDQGKASGIVIHATLLLPSSVQHQPAKPLKAEGAGCRYSWRLRTTLTVSLLTRLVAVLQLLDLSQFPSPNTTTHTSSLDDDDDDILVSQKNTAARVPNNPQPRRRGWMYQRGKGSDGNECHPERKNDRIPYRHGPESDVSTDVLSLPASLSASLPPPPPPPLFFVSLSPRTTNACLITSSLSFPFLSRPLVLS